MWQQSRELVRRKNSKAQKQKILDELRLKRQFAYRLLTDSHENLRKSRIFQPFHAGKEPGFRENWGVRTDFGFKRKKDDGDI